jgi:hypothetical protein
MPPEIFNGFVASVMVVAEAVTWESLKEAEEPTVKGGCHHATL